MDDQLRDSDGTTPGRAGRPVQQQRSRRRFFGIVAGALALAFLGRTSTAASAAAGEPVTDLPPEAQWCPGPDWERVPPSKPGGVGGWRNKKTGNFMTDWIPRQLSHDQQLQEEGFSWAWQEGKARVWVLGPGGERTRLEDLMPGGSAKLALTWYRCR